MSTLYIIATPIGNLEDLTYRAVRILKETDNIACEDTRRTKILLSRYQISPKKRIISHREANESQSVPGIIALLEKGESVALVSDAGYPGISDPGYRLISEALDRGINVEIIPGAGAVETALLSSGLPSDSFTFLGFPPRKQSQLQRFLEREKDSRHTLIIYESPARIAKLLKTSLEVFGDRKAAVCIELTKKFENTRRGFLSDLLSEFNDIKIRGEVTVVIAGNNPKFCR